MRILQRQNTKRVIAKRIVVKENKNDENTNDLKVSDENKVNNIDNKDDNINNKPIDNIQDSMATSSILNNDIGSEILESVKTVESKDR
jgi:hypothetical protein